MFDLIEEDLAQEKINQQQESSFTEAANPVYTMPTTYRQERALGKPDKKIIFLIFGSLFGFAMIGTVLFVYLSRSQTSPSISQMQKKPIIEEKKIAEGVQQTVVERPKEETTQETSSGQKQEVQEPEKPISVPQEKVVTVPLLGLDADQDGLTDVEERLYSTDPEKGDSDGDSYIDGDEIKNLYDPLRAEQARLDVSGLINTYTNQTYQYVLLYPSSWVAQSTDRTTDRETMISSATGEFFTITVTPNPNHLAPVDWYASQAQPGSDTSRLQSFVTDTWSGVMTENSQIIYLARKDRDPQKEDVIYTIQYNLNTKNELNFITTLQMILKSFVFTDLSFVR